MSNLDDIPVEKWEKMTLAEKIDTIPDDGGWWKSSSRKAYLLLGDQLTARGFSDDEAFFLLWNAYNAAANCFGK